MKLDHWLINGCGCGSYLDIFNRLQDDGARFGAYLAKSCGPRSISPHRREKFGWKTEKLGNPNPVVVYTGDVFLNSMALPTKPIEKWIDEFEFYSGNIPIIGSVWGEKPSDYVEIVKLIDTYCIGLQMNASCPNKEKGEKSVMEIMTQHMETTFGPVRDVTKKPLTIKLSPNEDYPSHAAALKGIADYLCCGNTVGPGLAIDIYTGKPILAGKYGGMSGPAMKPKIMKMVNDVYEIVKDSNCKVIASGGIKRWEDIIEYARAGASLFEVGTCAFTQPKMNGPNGEIFVRGKSNEEIVQFTKDLEEGVNEFLTEQKVTLEELVGSIK